MATNQDYLLELENIRKYFPVEKGVFERIVGTENDFVHAVDNISLRIQENEVYGLCGESGCGKTTTARVIGGLDFESSGLFKWKGTQLRPFERMKHSFRKKIQFIFQNPFQSLSPRMRVGHQVLDALIIQNQMEDPERVRYVKRTFLGFLLGVIFVLIGLMLTFFSYPETPTFVLPSLLSGLFLLWQGFLTVLFLREVIIILDYMYNNFIWLINYILNRIYFDRQTHLMKPTFETSNLPQRITVIILFFIFAFVLGFERYHYIKIQELLPFLNIAISFSSIRIILLLLGPVFIGLGVVTYFMLNYYPKLTYMDKSVIEIFQNVGLFPPETYYQKFPHQLSGGERQRVVIARALILNPELIVADEPTSMLDVSIRASILELISKMKDIYNISVLLITHDLATVSQFCDKVAIMYVGEIIENGNIDEIFNNPRHPYTWALIKAIPEPDPDKKLTGELPKGDVADAINPPTGCRFHPRCKFAQDRCRIEVPVLEIVSAKQSVACHFHKELEENGSLQV